MGWLHGAGVARDCARSAASGGCTCGRWATAGAHLHWWFFARPEGVLQLRGSSLSDWSDCIPPMPQDEWDDVHARDRAELARTGGEALV